MKICRELIFVVEKSDRTNRLYDLNLSMKNTLNYMNKLTIDEDCQFQISALIIYKNELTSLMQKQKSEELVRVQRKKREFALNQMFKKLQNGHDTCNRVVDVFISGMPLIMKTEARVLFQYYNKFYFYHGLTYENFLKPRQRRNDGRFYYRQLIT